jgi:hypothetical protein
LAQGGTRDAIEEEQEEAIAEQNEEWKREDDADEDVEEVNGDAFEILKPEVPEPFSV